MSKEESSGDPEQDEQEKVTKNKELE